jgi:hypothetical protein
MSTNSTLTRRRSSFLTTCGVEPTAAPQDVQKEASL